MIFLCLLCSFALCLARPQDVESVTSLESLQDETITDSPIPDTTDTKVEDFILVNDDVAVDPEGEDGLTTPANTTPANSDQEDVTAINDNIIDIIDNVVIDVKPSVVIKEKKVVSLRFTSYPDSSVVFRRASGPLGLNCDAESPVDGDIKFMWTKNGRFIDTNSNGVSFESRTNGNIIIFNPEREDEGLYQCVASNSEGVVFSPVVKVKMISDRTLSRSRAGADRALKTDDIAVYLPVSNNGQFSEEQQNIYLVMPATEQAEK